MQTDCVFCEEINNPVQNILNKNRIVYETVNFVLLPTVGCFEVGYLLVIPKQHFLCFGELSSDLIDELDKIIFRISEYIKKKDKRKCIIFEHGTRDIDGHTSSSIIHAHIHIIPFEKEIKRYLPIKCKLKKIAGFTDLRKETNNYLFLKDISGNHYVVENEDYPSQFFRQIVCNALGIGECWDWREHSFFNNMKKTIVYYKDL